MGKSQILGGLARLVKGKPATVKVPGFGEMPADRIPEIDEAAERYMRKVGRPGEHRMDEYPEHDPEFGARIAAEYDKMRHAPNDPAVKRSYDALIQETLEQYEALKGSGLEFKFLKDGMADPYARSPSQGYVDLLRNRQLYVFPTDQGYGSLTDIGDNPLLKRVGRVGDLENATANDAFRVVHDAYGHFGPGNPFFRAAGEDRAWMNHSRMYSPEARGAMTSETRGQNSWVNYGPHSRHNAGASGGDTVYADQKAGLMPEWTMKTEGKAKGGLASYAEGGKVGKVLKLGNKMMSVSTARDTPRNVIKLGSGNTSRREAVDAYLEELYNDIGKPHPFDDNAAILGNSSVSMSRHGDQVHLGDIRSLQPRSGAGTDSLRQLMDLADQHNVEISGTASAYANDPKFIRKTDRLRDWYAKNGFEIGDGDDDYGYEILYRPGSRMQKARGGLAHLKKGGQPEFPASRDDLNALKGYSTELSRDGFKKRFGHSTSDVNSMTHWDGAPAPDPTAPVPMAPMAGRFMGERYELPITAPKAVSDLVEGASELIAPQDALDVGLSIAGLPGKVVGKGAKAAALGLGYGLSSDEANAGIGGLRRASMFPIGKNFTVVENWEKRLLDGEPMNLWRDEGVYKGKDGLWRFEIDDSGMKLKDMPGKTPSSRRLSDYVEHEELWNQYPNLFDMPVHYAPDDANYNGFYRPPGDRANPEGITISKPYQDREYDFKKLLLHEAQHAIQQREGFTPGANPMSAGQGMRMEILNASRGVKNDAFAPKNPDEIEWARAMKDAIDNMREAPSDILARKAYLHNYGEIEARNVSNRINLSAAERRMRDNIPEYTTDIDTSDGAIVPGRGFEANKDAYERIIKQTEREWREMEAERKRAPDLSGIKFAAGGGVESDPMDDLLRAAGVDPMSKLLEAVGL